MLISKEIDEMATRRNLIHANHPTSRPLNETYQHVGITAELLFAKRYGLEMDRSLRPSGDGGYDFICGNLKLDIKGSKVGKWLLVERGKCCPYTIYVLVHVTEIGRRGNIKGWVWGWELLERQPRPSSFGIYNHRMRHDELRPMDKLSILR